jgi:aminoglycoside N3'-acetyltransferase
VNETESAAAIDRLIEKLEVGSGEIIYLGIDMARLPLPRWPTALTREAIRLREERWCAFVYERILNRIGSAGTLLVGAFSYSCSNPSVPFVLEESASEIGPFTNWVRRQSNAVRSLHPIFSVAGIGARAEEILGSVGSSAFGPISPFGRISTLAGRFVNLGIPFRQSLTYVHHLEQCYGCNHRYNKVLTTPVFKGGRRIERDFLA